MSYNLYNINKRILRNLIQSTTICRVAMSSFGQVSAVFICCRLLFVLALFNCYLKIVTIYLYKSELFIFILNC